MWLTQLAGQESLKRGAVGSGQQPFLPAVQDSIYFPISPGAVACPLDWPGWGRSMRGRGAGEPADELTLASVTLNSRRMYCGMLYSAMGSTTKYWYRAERSAGQY